MSEKHNGHYGMTCVDIRLEEPFFKKKKNIQMNLNKKTLTFGLLY